MVSTAYDAIMSSVYCPKQFFCLHNADLLLVAFKSQGNRGRNSVMQPNGGHKSEESVFICIFPIILFLGYLFNYWTIGHLFQIFIVWKIFSKGDRKMKKREIKPMLSKKAQMKHLFWSLFQRAPLCASYKTLSVWIQCNYAAAYQSSLIFYRNCNWHLAASTWLDVFIKQLECILFWGLPFNCE